MLWEGRFEEALDIANSALEGMRRASFREWIGLAHLVIAAIQIRAGMSETAKLHGEAALHYYRWEVDDRTRLAQSYEIIGVALKNLGRWLEAESNLRLALECQGKLHDIERVRMSLNLAILLRKIGRLREAARVCREGIEVCRSAGLGVYELSFFVWS